MNSLYHEIELPGITIPGNIFLAPIAGFSDAPFRSVSVMHGADMCFTEMVSCDGIIRDGEKTIALMKPAENEKFLAIQVFTSDPKIAKESMKTVLEYNPSVIDLNCGCPVPKVIKNGAGSALMKDPVRLGEVVKAMNEGIAEAGKNIPVSVKIRSGWDSGSLNFLKAAETAVDSGASMVSLHPRTRVQGYSGKADWTLIKELKKNITVPVIGSGDLFSSEDAYNMISSTACDGVMFSRGSLGNPWIFSMTRALLKTGTESPPPQEDEKINTALRHLELAVQLHGEQRACREMKKHLCSYTKGTSGAASLRNKIVHASSFEEYKSILTLN